MKTLTVFDARPEAIKTTPLVKVLATDLALDVGDCVTSRHRQTLEGGLDHLAIRRDFYLNLMEPGQDLNDVASNALLGIQGVCRQSTPW